MFRQLDSADTFAREDTAVETESPLLVNDDALEVSVDDTDSRARNLSMASVFFTSLVSEAARGLFLPSQWPYLEKLGGNREALGVIMAVYSLGRAVAHLPLGVLIDRFSMRDVLFGVIAFQILGHLVYLLAGHYRVLILSRAIVGLGGTMSISRTYVTRCSDGPERTNLFAYLSAIQFLGFAVLPGVAGLLVYLPSLEIPGVVSFDEFTYPAVLLIMANVGSFFLLYRCYKDPSPPEPVGRRRSMEPDMQPRPGSKFWPILTCLVINLYFRGVIAEFETVVPPILMNYYGLSLASASFDVGFLGFLGLFLYLGFKPLSNRFSDRELVLGALSCALIGSSLLILQSRNMNGTLWFNCGLAMVWSLAYPIGQTAILALFSKIVKGLPDGSLIGIFSSTGSISRVLCALLAATIWDWMGIEAVFMQLLAFGTLAWMIGLWRFPSLNVQEA